MLRRPYSKQHAGGALCCEAAWQLPLLRAFTGKLISEPPHSTAPPHPSRDRFEYRGPAASASQEQQASGASGGDEEVEGKENTDAGQQEAAAGAAGSIAVQ